MDGRRRMRVGAMIGAVAGPPLCFLVAYRLLTPAFGKPVGASGGVLFLVAVLGAWVVGAIGVPLLGASLGHGSWIGRELGRRLANHLIGGGLAAGMLSGVVAMAVPVLGQGQGAVPFRLLVCVIGLQVGIHLCFRERSDPPPA